MCRVVWFVRTDPVKKSRDLLRPPPVRLPTQTTEQEDWEPSVPVRVDGSLGENRRYRHFSPLTRPCPPAERVRTYLSFGDTQFPFRSLGELSPQTNFSRDSLAVHPFAQETCRPDKARLSPFREPTRPLPSNPQTLLLHLSVVKTTKRVLAPHRPNPSRVLLQSWVGRVHDLHP